MSNLEKYTNLHKAVQFMGDDNTIDCDEFSEAAKVISVGALGAMGLGIALASAVEDGLTPSQEAAALEAMADLSKPLAKAITTMAGQGISFDETDSKVELTEFASAIGEISDYCTDQAVAAAESASKEPASEA